MHQCVLTVQKFQIMRHRPEQTLNNIKRQEFPLFLPPDTKLKKQEGSSLNHSCSPKGISFCKIIIYSGYLGRNKCCIENAQQFECILCLANIGNTLVKNIKYKYIIPMQTSPTLVRKKRFKLNFLIRRDASKVAIIIEKEKPMHFEQL